MGAPMILGAALGGGISAARGGNPLLGALLGGVGGGIFAGAGGAAASAANAGAGLAPAATGLKLGSISSLSAPAAIGGSGLTLGSTTGLGSLSGAMGAAPQVAAGSLAPPTFTGLGFTPAATSVGIMDTLSQLPKSISQFGKENPFVSQMTYDAAKEEFRQKQVPTPGLLRGRPAQEEAPTQYSMSVPKISLI